MISCEQAQNLFNAYLNEELSAAFTAELDAHRLECAACRHQLALLEACGNVVRLDVCEPAISGDFTDRLMAILDEGESRRGWLQLNRKMKIVGGLVGVAAAIAVLAVVLPTGSKQQPAPPPSGVAGATAPAEDGQQPIVQQVLGLPAALFVVPEHLESSIELGELGLNQIQGTTETSAPAEELPYPNLPVLPEVNGPELDVLDTVPDLDDGGELL